MMQFAEEKKYRYLISGMPPSDRCYKICLNLCVCVELCVKCSLHTNPMDPRFASL